MIKKILCAFLLGLLAANSYAEKVTVSFKKGDTPIDVYAERTIEVLKKHIPDEENRNAVIEKILEISEERKQTSTSHKYAIRVEDFTELCRLAGWDGARKEDTQKCVAFAEAFLSLSYVGYMQVCNVPKAERKPNMRCIDDFFYHSWTLEDTKVTMLQASGLSKEYARVRHNDDIECFNKPRALAGPLWTANYYVRCRSKTDANFYEFLFDGVYESWDTTITKSVEEAICKIHGVSFIEESDSQKTTFQAHIDYYAPGCDTGDANLCSEINKSMKMFGYSAKMDYHQKYKKAYCAINEHVKSSISSLRTAFGIDNTAFRREGHQFSSYEGMRDQLCDYIKRNADTEITDCYCLYNRTLFINGGLDLYDDVLTCYANDQAIDFLFDDLSEGNKTVAKGGLESFNCSVLGGEYQGKTCFTPDKELCERIAEATLRECPECKAAYFDTDKNACVLPNATKSIQHQKNVNIALLAGGVVVNVGLTLYFGGTNWAIFVVVADSAFAGMELGGQMHIDGVADTFFTKANNCNNATCAEEILKEYFMYLARMTNDLQDGELTGADAKFAELVEMLPEDSQFLIDLYISGCYTPEDENLDISKCDDGKWNTDQIIRAIGIAGQLFTLVGAGVKAVVGAERISRVLSKTPGLEKALTKKIPGVRESILRKLSKGGQVLRSDGKAIKALEQSGELVQQPKSTGVLVGILDEGFMPSVQMDDFIKQLEKEGFRVERAGDHMGKKTYKVFSDTGNNVDIELLQKQFLANATEKDKNARLAALGLYYDSAKTMNVSYKETKQLVKAGKWADATVLDPKFDIKVTPLELGGKKYYLKSGNTESLIQNEISRTKQAHELLKHNKIVTSVGVVEDDQTVLKAFMDAHPDITLPRTPDTQYFIMDATHVNTVEWGVSDAEILGYLRNKPITIEEQNIILREIQNMNNNGLIHNDIWHNFAIYRDSGGNLHMELMDFGDFTAEEKLRRSNDDVLEIKKLFSRWSDRGLVEKK